MISIFINQLYLISLKLDITREIFKIIQIPSENIIFHYINYYHKFEIFLINLIYIFYE